MSHKEAVTASDIKRYKGWMDADPKTGADKMYNDLNRKGFSSAAWVRNEFVLNCISNKTQNGFE